MSKTVSIRVDEEIFNKYTSLNKEKFKSKFIELIDKFYSISVNSCKQSVNSCKQQNVNKSYVDPLREKILASRHEPDEEEINNFIDSVDWERIK